MPLFNTLKGVDLNIQIQITPSQTIPDDISEAFVDNLKQVAYKVLTDIVQLERHQVSLWYLPHSNVNPTEYYLLDVFLFSPSNVIEYSAVIGKIKQFFLKMKTGAKLAILEPSNINLNVQFKHGLELRRNEYKDISNGQTLEPLMEKEWTFMYLGPFKTISEVNWCFRTVFDLSEIEHFKLYIRVKSTDTFVFMDQLDYKQGKFYLCIDLFIEFKRVEEDSQIIREGKPSSDDDKDITTETDDDSERGLIAIVSLPAVILLLVILYKVKNAMTKKQLEESTRSNHSPSDFVELNVINNLSTATADHMRMNDKDDENHTNRCSSIGQDDEVSTKI